MKLLVQPDDGVEPLLKGIARAKHKISIVIFRFDQKVIERALAAAVSRGVAVHALIAHTNRAGEENLRRLELRLLAAGITVARTANDLDRYHSKFMVIDGRELYLLAFNWTRLDIAHSRSFGLITTSRPVVQEAERLFEADTKRNPCEPGNGKLVVSPVNARKLLAEFIRGARKELVIYDLKVSDPEMLTLLEQRSRAGVAIKVIGRVTRKIHGIEVCKPAPMRLHARTMVRDGGLAFVGSQSLRAGELDSRREVGIIFRDSKIAARLLRTFTQDWTAAGKTARRIDEEPPAEEIARKVAKAVTKSLPETAVVLNGAVKEVVGREAGVELNAEEVEETVRTAVKEAVKSVVADLVQDAVEGTGR
jgi:phosphatidylserine/phosphatidylglycerophosphate/cardiolipin synthase-like enzyme